VSGYILSVWFLIGVCVCWRMAWQKPEVWNAMSHFKQFKAIMGIGLMWPVILLLKSTLTEEDK
jgi:hypothetical protein